MGKRGGHHRSYANNFVFQASTLGVQTSGILKEQKNDRVELEMRKDNIK